MLDRKMLLELGLTNPQAKAYITLVQSGRTTPPELAERIKESRSNTYKVLDTLVDIGLVVRHEDNKKLQYSAANPIALENFALQARNRALAEEQKIKSAMPALFNFFFTHNEQPGIRFFQGKEGLNQVFNDIIRTGKDEYFIRSPSDVEFYESDFFTKFRKRQSNAGIKTYAITPDVPSANHNPAIDIANNFNRTWIPKESYSAKVEWKAYGDKVAVISYGEVAVAMIIDSPQIAESFRQIFHLISTNVDYTR
jgi:sugar-specific transcriptional regulator TrmB